MKKIYIVIIGSGEWEDYHESIKFATFSKIDANKWVEKFNRIVDENEARLLSWDFEGEQPYMYDYIAYDKPIAFVRKTDLK